MPLSYRMLNIEGVPAGLLGLEELFSRLFADEVVPNAPETPGLILDGVKEHNFIPKPAIQSYVNTLQQEYQRYYRKRKSGNATVARNYGTWHGYPREQIPWFPTIADQLCTNCGACLDLCAREVTNRMKMEKFGWQSRFYAWWAVVFARVFANPKPSLCPVRTF